MANRSEQNTTNYKHPEESNLYDLHKAMEYNGNGQPTVRVNGSTPSSQTAWGEPIAIEPTPVIQLDAVYGIQEKDIQTFSAAGGTASYTEDSEFFVQTGSSNTTSFAVLRSQRFIRYRPGQGAIGRFACRFENPQPDSQMRAGLFNQEQALQIGYINNTFAILHEYGKRAHIENLTITTAPNAAQTVTISLDGEPYNIPLVAESAELTASRIAKLFPASAQWIVTAYDNVVEFLYTGSTRPLTGAFGFSSTGNAAGTMTTITEGKVGVTNWIPQALWNGDKMDGTGASGVTLDPSKYNVFQISYRWLGAGEIRFTMENPETGDFVVLHHIHWTNRNTILHMHNPSLRLGFVAYRYAPGSTTTPPTIYGGSLYGAIEGKIVFNGNPAGAYTSKSGLAGGDFHHLGTLENPIIVNGKANTRTLELKNLNVAFQGNDPLTVIVYINDPQLATGTQIFNKYPGMVARASLVDGTVDPASETAVAAFTLPINGSGQFNLESLNLVVPPGKRFMVVVNSGQAVSQISASLTWIED